MSIRRNFTTESEMISGCISGDRKAQQHLYDQYCGRFLAICLRYIKDRDLAEDVMIEGFMKIFEKLHQFEERGSLEGWMKKLMVREALMALRKNKNLMLEVALDIQEEIQGHHYEIRNMEAEELMEMIHALPLGYRTVFNLYALEGYSHAEIGDLLGISESTSKSQLSRARALLKQRLAQQQLNEKSTHG